MIFSFFLLSDLSHSALLHVLLIVHKLHDPFILRLHLLLLHASPLSSLFLERFDVLLSGSDRLQFQLSLP